MGGISAGRVNSRMEQYRVNLGSLRQEPAPPVWPPLREVWRWVSDRRRADFFGVGATGVVVGAHDEEPTPDWFEEVRYQAVRLDAEVTQWTKRIEALNPEQPLLRGVGALTTTLIGLEVLDWSRFTNRRQVASYTGLCPSEHSSGDSRRQGGITKTGNTHARRLLTRPAQIDRPASFQYSSFRMRL